ncbi:MAG: hypothetical protein V8S70_06115 [Muribaculaceae bacterium]
MKIRKVLASDLDAVMEIVDAARGIMRASGNMRQWTGGYPDKTVMTADIRRGVCYGCEDGGKLSAVFSMIPAPTPHTLTSMEERGSTRSHIWWYTA